ncbi:MAG: helix-turn-helix domain-containing protein [Selenomonadaceae bacterium]|nr:helix-turn-helix domain-containing protein [Selenomonadaceae bacterium]
MFGEKLKSLRKAKKISQEEFAEMVGTHVNSVSKWENGVIPRMSNIQKIAKVLDTTSEYLLDEESPVTPVVQIITKEKGDDNAAFVRDLIKSSPMMIYENDKERFFIPATSEGFDFVTRLRTSQNNNKLISVTAS